MLYSDHYSGNTYAHILLLVLHSQTSHCAYSANPVVSSVCLHTIPFLHIQTRLPNIHLSIVQCILPVFIFQAFVQRFITDRCIFIRRHFSKLEVRSWKIHNSLIHKLIKYSVFTLIHYFAFSASFKGNSVPSKLYKISDVLVVCTFRIFQYIFSVECSEKI